MPVNKYWHQSGCDTPVDSALRVCRLLSLVQYQGTRWICRLFLSRWGCHKRRVNDSGSGNASHRHLKDGTLLLPWFCFHWFLIDHDLFPASLASQSGLSTRERLVVSYEVIAEQILSSKGPSIQGHCEDMHTLLAPKLVLFPNEDFVHFSLRLCTPLYSYIVWISTWPQQVHTSKTFTLNVVFDIWIYALQTLTGLG